MKSKDNGQAEKALRRRAEEIAREKQSRSPVDINPMSLEESRQALHELRVNQIQLEMQNEEMRRAQVELETSRERYFDLYDMAPVGYVTISEDGEILEANLTIATMLGVARSALVNKLLSAFIFSEDQNACYLQRKKVFETGVSQVSEMRMARQDGSLLWVRVEGIKSENIDGLPVCRAMVSDITGHKREEAIQAFLARTTPGAQSDSFFEGLARNLAESFGMDFVCVDRLEGDSLTARTLAVWCDGKFEDNVTYALKDTPCGVVVGKEVCSFPASVARFFPRDQVLQDLRAESYIGVTLWSHTGKPIGLIAVIGRRPLASTSQAEATLKLVGVRAAGELERLLVEEELIRFRKAIETSGEVVFLTDCDGTITYINPEFVRVYGHNPGEVVGKTTPRILKSDKMKPEAHKLFWDMLLSKQIVKGELINKTKDGRLLLVEGSANAILDDGGHIIGFLAVQRDITDRKTAEEEHQTIAKLESVGTLAGGIAHDFNNLLTGILGNIQLAQIDIGPKSKAEGRLLEAEKACLRARDLTQQLLTFAKGGAPIKKTIALGGLIKDSATFAVRGSKARCEFSWPDDLYQAEADEGQIGQVINNMVINADQAMPDGGVIQITARNLVLEDGNTLSLPGGKYIQVGVEDHGIGIAEKYLSKIFDPYFTTKEKGHGLGLASAYSIIKNHGGKITVESKMGFGTIFHAYLPASKQPAPVETPPAPKRVAVSGKGRILVMDDEPVIRSLLSNMLTVTGYESALVKDGDEAVELYRKAKESGRTFDAVIMDLTIPGGMGGKEAVKKVLEIDPEAKVIVSSGYANDPIMAEYGKYGFCGVIAKPFAMNRLVELLARLLTNENQ